LLKFGESDSLFTLFSCFIDDRPTAFVQAEKGKYNSDEIDLIKKLRLLNIFYLKYFVINIEHISINQAMTCHASQSFQSAVGFLTANVIMST
tara:strand:+ start:163 stop:438 length:276 start_codon:yes stop_codon:yes gene_type:complete